MGMNYKKLWHLLLNSEMKKKGLHETCGLSLDDD